MKTFSNLNSYLQNLQKLCVCLFEFSDYLCLSAVFSVYGFSLIINAQGGPRPYPSILSLYITK